MQINLHEINKSLVRLDNPQSPPPLWENEGELKINIIQEIINTLQ